ncbi:zinc-dependent peptidase [Macromonas nakdongensis]|uniref:M90 family metallopeptidase n=1 Tax=Macromonas nakdongensis TaxID=1843082 RepID=UPI000C337CFB|nr:M90 family metallopeptidase [Macromonas nakdongensis]
MSAPTSPANWFGRLWQRWRRQPWWRTLAGRWHTPPDIPEGLWQHVLQAHPFLADLSTAEQAALRQLCRHFIAHKEFHGAQGLHITDAMAVTVAAQACLPLLHWGLPGLTWYRDFVGIVIHPGEVLAQRQVTDAAGVVHHYAEALLGEAMHGGPVMLSWSHVRGHPDAARAGHNLVIHEFAHKLDMRHKAHDETADGCPRLPAAWPGLTAGQARAHWRRTLYGAHANFQRAVEMADRFGAPAPWLDAYGAQSPAEFFAVACEAYFVNRPRFGEAFPELLPLFDAFFRRPAVSGAAAP